MKRKGGILSLFYILLPLIIGYLSSESGRLNQILFDNFKWITIIVGLLYWFWVGRQFGLMYKNRLVNYLFGNATTLISLAIYLWFQKYVWLSRDFINIFRVASREIINYFRVEILKTSDIIIIAHVFMILIFTLGFFTIKRNRKALF